MRIFFTFVLAILAGMLAAPADILAVENQQYLPTDTETTRAASPGLQSLIEALRRPQSTDPSSIVIAAMSCSACGAQSRSCHAPCNSLPGPMKGNCHSKCRSQLSRCKASCARSAKKGGKKGGGKTVKITIDLSGKSKKKKVSAKEARKIAIATRNQAVAATPPNIDDITAILREQKPDPKQIAELSKDADKKPPKTKSSAELAKFYQERGLAAGKIGRTEQELDDLAKAVKYAKATKSKRVMYEAFGYLSTAQGAAGYYKDAIANREMSVKYAPQTGSKLVSSAILAATNAQQGRLAEAERTMADVRKLMRQGVSADVWKKWGAHWSSRAKLGQAVIFESKGDFAGAEALYRSALDDVDKSMATVTDVAKEYLGIIRQVLRTQLSKMLEAQGRIVEAELEIRRALLDRLKETGLYSTWAPRIVMDFAERLAVQGRYEESRQLTNVAIEAMNKLGFAEGSTRLVDAQLLLARLAFLSGNFDEALAIHDALDKKIGQIPENYQRAVVTDVDRLLVYSISGRHDDVIRTLRSAGGTQAAKGGADVAAAGTVTGGALAIALARSGDTEAAYAEFGKVIPKLISLSEEQADEEYTIGTARESRKAIIFEAYLGMLADMRGTPLEAKFGNDAAAEAFRIADEAREQLVQKAVSAASARASVDNDELAELLRTEQDTRKRLTAQSGLLASILATPSDQQDPKAVKDLRGNISELKKVLDALLADIKKKFPDYAALLNPQAPGIADIQKALRPDEAFVSIYLGRERSYVWALPNSGELAFHVSDLTQERAGKYVEALRGALNPQIATLGDIPDFDVRIAHGLYEKILQPVEAGWKQAKSVLVSTNGALGQLPLTVLPTEKGRVEEGDGPLFGGYRDVKWLARSHAMTLLPSAATLVTLRSIPQGKQDRKPFIGFGDPLFNKAHAKKKEAAPTKVADALASRGVLRTRGLPVRLRAAPKMEGIEKPDLSRLPPLPDTADEVRSLAIAMQADPSAALKLGVKANEDTIRKQDLSGYKVIAFATHGLIPGDLAGLREPALALSAPKIAHSEGDGLLTMSEIMGLKLDADWVVLSACNTGSGRGAGAEAVSGLGRAFFYAGTRALLVSSWPVETTSARLLTTDVFDRLTKTEGLSRAAALQQAISALIDKPGQLDPETKEPLFYYAHPIFWAPFILVGDGAA